MIGTGLYVWEVVELIDRSGCEPVLAENFPAGTASPRTACLDGVAPLAYRLIEYSSEE